MGINNYEKRVDDLYRQHPGALFHDVRSEQGHHLGALKTMNEVSHCFDPYQLLRIMSGNFTFSKNHRRQQFFISVNLNPLKDLAIIS